MSPKTLTTLRRVHRAMKAASVPKARMVQRQIIGPQPLYSGYTANWVTSPISGQRYVDVHVRVASPFTHEEADALRQQIDRALTDAGLKHERLGGGFKVFAVQESESAPDQEQAGAA